MTRRARGGDDAEERTEGTAHAGHDHRHVRHVLEALTEEELRRIPILPPGTALLPGTTYTDLALPTPREFVAAAGTVATDETLYVQKSEVPEEIWRRVVGPSSRD